MHPDRLNAHLQVARYGEFRLTNAIRPAPGARIQPREGYRVEVFRDRLSRIQLPMLSAAVSAERVFDTFLELVETLGSVVHVVVESSHEARLDRHVDLRRDAIDLPVLASHLCDFEDLLTHDGCTGIAVISTRRPIEIQFDEHKLLHVYSPEMKPFRRILRRAGLTRQSELALISEAEHFHHTTEGYADEFRELALRLGVGEFNRVFSDDW